MQILFVIDANYLSEKADADCSFIHHDQKFHAMGKARKERFLRPYVLKSRRSTGEITLRVSGDEPKRAYWLPAFQFGIYNDSFSSFLGG